MADRKIKIILDASVGGFTAKMAAAGKSVSDTANKMTGASKESAQFRKGLDQLGGTAGKIGLVAAAGVGAAVVAAANFEQSMSRVEAATHASASTMEDLRKAAIVAGRDTVFSATESADAITAMSKAGVGAGDILKGGLTGSLSLASAGELDVASAAEIAATAMNQFQLAGKDIPHIADLLAASAGKAQGEVTDMANSLKFVGPVAHQMGISIEETTGAIAELASQGILGEQAGTSLRGMLTALTSPSKLAAKEMKNLGINLYDAQGQFVGFRGVAEQLNTTMSGLSSAERDQALGRIFGNEQITAARILYAGGAEDVDKWTKAVNDQGYAAETAAIKMDNLRGDLEQLKGSLETALIGAGTGSQGPLRDLAQGATGAVNAFTKLPPVLQSTATGMLGITAIAGGGLWFGVKVVKSITDTREALKNLGDTSTRTAGVLRGAFKGAVIVGGILAVSDALDSLLNTKLEGSNLDRSLEALRRGDIEGTLKDTFGASLSGLGEQVAGAVDFMSSPGFAKSIASFGGLGDLLSGGTAAAHDNIVKLDQSLASMVESGNADDAADLFATITAKAKETGTEAGFTAKAFEQYQLAVKNAAIANSGAATLMDDALTGLIPAVDGVTAATGPMGAAVQQSAEDLDKQAKALDKARDAAGATAREFVGLGESFDKPKVSLDAWIADMEKQNQALRDLLVNAKLAAKNNVAKGLIAELEQQGPAGALRLKQLATATETEVGRANKAYRDGTRVVEEFKDAVAGRTQIDIDTEKAERKLRRLRRLMNSFKDIQVHVTAVTGSTQAGANAAQFADNHSYAGGGYTGLGGKYEPAGVVHKREYVFSSEATQGNERYLDILHRSLRGYATGGMVGASAPAAAAPLVVSLSAADVHEVARAVATMRPVYGDVHLSGDGSFERHQRQRLSTLDGVRRT